MGSRALLLAVLLLGGALAAAHAQCTAAPSQPDDEDPEAPWLGACKRCSADGSVCAECWTTYTVNATGQCERCDNPGQCFQCKGNDPSFCLKCGDWWGEAETGFYATKDGKCKACPQQNCMQCESLTGKCTMCATGMGVMPDGTCQPCKDENCISCNGDSGVCSPVEPYEACMSGFFLEGGACKACPAHCDRCTNATTCVECDSQGWVINNSTAQCDPCASEGCTYCPRGPTICDNCDIGYTNMTDLSCAKCTDKRCTTCEPDNPGNCTICASTASDSWYGGPNEKGVCVRCAMKHCQACQTNYKVCDWCDDGYFNDAQLGKCTPCTNRWEHCSSCGIDATEQPEVPACFGCEDGWELDESAGRGKATCKPAKKKSSRKKSSKGG